MEEDYSTSSTELQFELSLSGSSAEGSSSNERSENPKQNTRSLFMKVYFDGLPFGRTVDLSTHDGYQSLEETVEELFSIKIINSASNILTYEDIEGDWNRVGDVPWE
ncbi:auxin-responsive protein IAA31-like [Phalaenopsis equestris]|uniref:auxin-responsive protein IAA31-like n=1 Tax=Phalaenopsis equestris TaxID=78828 RepID=UPI0009E23C02|nr:auxin-responsive protein IAA31-like [Phalaenopsis equestris]